MISSAYRFVLNGFGAFRRNRTLREFLWSLALGAAALTLAAISAAIVAPFDSASKGPVENGWYELTQAIVLGFTLVCLFFTAIRARHEIFYFSIFTSMLCVLAAIRETPRCGSAFYSGGVCLPESLKTETIVVAAVVIALLVAIKRVPIARRWDELTFFYVVPAAFSAGFLAMSAVFERSTLVWLEEICEMSAYLNLFGFSLILYLRPDLFARRPRPLVA